MNQPISINFGPDHRSALALALGVEASAIRNLRVVDSSPYVTPHYTVYALPNGRYARVVSRVASSLVTLYESNQEWRETDNALWVSFPDPDTGRVK